MDTIYVNRADWEGPPLDLLAEARVFNAPRPLYGDGSRGGTWTGQFRAGTFYAAVWPNTYRAEWLIQANERDGASEVIFVDNADVERMLTEQLAKHGYRIEDYTAIGMTIGQAAAEHRLPWHEEEGPRSQVG